MISVRPLLYIHQAMPSPSIQGNSRHFDARKKWNIGLERPST
jgi:hypothetical protein